MLFITKQKAIQYAKRKGLQSWSVVYVCGRMEGTYQQGYMVLS